MRIIKLDAIDSTNHFLKALSAQENCENFTVVSTESQTEGKGQRGSGWVSESGKNLTFSVLYNQKVDGITSLFTLNIMVALSVVEALKLISNLNFVIKWPNDIMSGNFKLGGILANSGQKLYAEATVDLITHDSSYDFLKFEELRGLYLEFQDLMAAQKEIDVVDGDGYSFKIAHYIGLSEVQKLALLEIVSEFDRQDYLIQHLKLIIPSMRNIKETQARITANGHFKNLKSFNFTQGES